MSWELPKSDEEFEMYFTYTMRVQCKTKVVFSVRFKKCSMQPPWMRTWLLGIPEPL